LDVQIRCFRDQHRQPRPDHCPRNQCHRGSQSPAPDPIISTSARGPQKLPDLDRIPRFSCCGRSPPVSHRGCQPPQAELIWRRLDTFVTEALSLALGQFRDQGHPQLDSLSRIYLFLLLLGTLVDFGWLLCYVYVSS